MELTELVRLRLRIKSKDFDEGEIGPLISAAQADLKRVGVDLKADDPLLQQAVVLYCKANFGYSEDSDKFKLAYEGLRDALALSVGYGKDGKDGKDGKAGEEAGDAVQ